MLKRSYFTYENHLVFQRAGLNGCVVSVCLELIRAEVLISDKWTQNKDYRSVLKNSSMSCRRGVPQSGADLSNTYNVFLRFYNSGEDITDQISYTGIVFTCYADVIANVIRPAALHDTVFRCRCQRRTDESRAGARSCYMSPARRSRLPGVLCAQAERRST